MGVVPQPLTPPIMPKALEDLRKKIADNLKGKNNPKTNKPYTEDDIWAIAQSQYKKMQNKETKYCTFGKIELKEDDKDFYVRGYIATTHPDRAAADGFEGDILSKAAVQKIVAQLNDKYKPEAGAVSESHDWVKQNNPTLPLAGVAVEPATLEELSDGNWAAKVGTVLAKTNPRYDTVKTNIEQGVYPGFSIEYDDTQFMPIVKEGKKYRYITDLDLKGFGFAHRRLIANPHAEVTEYGYKELMLIKKELKTGEPKMENVESKEKVESKVDVPEVKESMITVTKEQMEKLMKIEAKERADAESVKIKEMVDLAVKEVLSKESPALNTKEGAKKKCKFKEIEHPYHKAQARMKELDQPMTSNDHRVFLHKDIIDTQYKEAARLANDMIAAGVPVFQNWMMQSYSGELELKQRALKMVEVGNRIELKETRLHDIELKSGEGLQTDTNLAHASWTYGSYYQSPVELNDIYGQAIINQLNDQTVTWGKLKKEDWSGRSDIKFRARTGRNSTAGGYAEGANLVYGTDFTGTVGRQKFQQPYAYYRVLVAVTGQELQLAKAPGGIGDIWAEEIKWSTEDLNVVLNQAIIGTGDGTSESTCLGFEGLILGTTGTLYSRNIATYTTLKSHKESVSGRITLDQIRKMIRYCEAGDASTITNSNANRNDLVFFCNHLQRDFIYSLIQDMQRTVPTSARVGYEGVLSVDGVPVFADKHYNTDDLFLIDTAHTKIGINLPPTLEALPVTADAKAAHIKIYFNLYSDAPSNNYWAYGLSTS